MKASFPIKRKTKKVFTAREMQWSDARIVANPSRVLPPQCVVGNDANYTQFFRAPGKVASHKRWGGPWRQQLVSLRATWLESVVTMRDGFDEEWMMQCYPEGRINVKRRESPNSNQLHATVMAPLPSSEKYKTIKSAHINKVIDLLNKTTHYFFFLFMRLKLFCVPMSFSCTLSTTMATHQRTAANGFPNLWSRQVTIYHETCLSQLLNPSKHRLSSSLTYTAY